MLFRSAVVFGAVVVGHIAVVDVVCVIVVVEQGPFWHDQTVTAQPMVTMLAMNGDLQRSQYLQVLAMKGDLQRSQ